MQACWLQVGLALCMPVGLMVTNETPTSLPHQIDACRVCPYDCIPVAPCMLPSFWSWQREAWSIRGPRASLKTATDISAGIALLSWCLHCDLRMMLLSGNDVWSSFHARACVCGWGGGGGREGRMNWNTIPHGDLLAPKDGCYGAVKAPTCNNACPRDLPHSVYTPWHCVSHCTYFWFFCDQYLWNYMALECLLTFPPGALLWAFAVLYSNGLCVLACVFTA